MSIGVGQVTTLKKFDSTVQFSYLPHKIGTRNTDHKSIIKTKYAYHKHKTWTSEPNILVMTLKIHFLTKKYFVVTEIKNNRTW